MKKRFFIFILLLAAVTASAQTPASFTKLEMTRVEASPSDGFSYSYFLFVPPELKTAKTTQTILVLPNNTGKLDDDLNVHEDAVRRRNGQTVDLAGKLGAIVLMPAFPRPKSEWKIYTHALDRDSLLTDKKEYSRFDRQLIAMIDHARANLNKERIKTDKRVLIMGFSASGMFSNRFAFLHPDRVKGAAVGSPGGWPIAPAATYKEKSLRYPIGIGDFKTTTGRSLNKKSLRKVPFFIYLGDQDDNDSLPFGDGYETEDKDLVFELFGKTPVERWEISKKLYADNGLTAEFKLYPGVKHTISTDMFNDILAFLKKHK